MGKRTAKHAHKNRSAFLAYGLLTLMVVLIAIGGISAKYFLELGEETGIVTARDFYFESDLLAERNPVYNLAAGTTTVTFDLRNYTDELRWADDDISYTVAVTEQGKDSTDAALSSAEGTIEKGSKKSASITLSGMKDGGTYIVKAVGKAGYQKELEATFVVDTANRVYKHLSTNGVQVVLTVWTEDVTGKASFTIPEGLIPNVTESPELQTVSNYKDGHYQSANFTDDAEFAPYTSKKYHFIKEDPATAYDYSAFGKVTVETTEAIVGTP